jgi:hypothetical protein
MFLEVEPQSYKEYFTSDPHPFISSPFIELNRSKVDGIIRLAGGLDKPTLGLIAGKRNNMLLSPFSAPFGGFHFRNEITYVSEIDAFIGHLKGYILENNYKGFEITLPPDIYNKTFNAKCVNSFLRAGFSLKVPEITNWVELAVFKDSFSQKNSREYYRQAQRNGLRFEMSFEERDQESGYELIKENREKFGRPIYMAFKDILRTSSLWPVDFFKVLSGDGTLVAAAIFYRSHPEICYAVFWGDNEKGRPLRAMDFLSFNLWIHYKNLGYKYIDLGISTETGVPNEGLLRFKETHDSISSLRYKFVWHSE